MARWYGAPSQRLAVAQVLDVDVGAESWVVGQVPAVVVGVVVNYDLVCAPVPIVDEAVVGGSDIEVETAEPEAIAIATFDAPLMAAADAASEAAMLKRMIDVIAGVIAAGIVANPLIIGVDVRGIGVAIFVGVSRGFLLWCALRFLWCSALVVLLRPGRRGAVSRNMAVADVASLRRASVLIAAVLFFLR
jgi:hypothetical protein